MLGRRVLVHLDQRIRGNAQPLMQPPDHLQAQRALAVEDLVNTAAVADLGHQIFRRQPVLLHVVADGGNRIRQVDWVVLGLPGLDEGDQNIEMVAVGRIALRCHHDDRHAVEAEAPELPVRTRERGGQVDDRPERIIREFVRPRSVGIGLGANAGTQVTGAGRTRRRGGPSRGYRPPPACGRQPWR